MTSAGVDVSSPRRSARMRARASARNHDCRLFRRQRGLRVLAHSAVVMVREKTTLRAAFMMPPVRAPASPGLPLG